MKLNTIPGITLGNQHPVFQKSDETGVAADKILSGVNLLGSSHLPTFSCRESGILGFQLKEIFLGINYGAWKKGDEKILQTDSKKGVLDFRGIPDKYLEDSQDINIWYGVFLHVLANGISNKAEGILLHYEKDLYFRIVKEIIDGEERFTAIFSMQD